MNTHIPKYRWQSLACGIALGLFSIAPALAVHDDGVFELDGNAINDDYGALEGTKGGDDWSNIFGLGNGPGFPNPRGTPSADGFGETFVVDTGNNESAFSGSNKDIHDVNTWEWKRSKVTPDKDNLLNAYASAEVNGLTRLYFGTDRLANNGDAALGFWFFQNEITLVPPAPGIDGSFVGEHADGDVLVQVDYRQGSTSSGPATEVEVFVWQGDGLGSHGTLDQVLSATFEGTGAVCDTNDFACAVTNFAAAVSPWAYAPKSGSAGTFPAESLFEGGINITGLFGEVCFASFMANSRTSHSETAELKDFALGDFDTCGSLALANVCTATPPLNPVLVDNGTRVLSTFDVTFTNDGTGGPIHDLQIMENAVAAEHDKSDCQMIAVDGIGVGPTALPDGQWVNVGGGSLAAGINRVVKVTCEHATTALPHDVSGRAAQSPGGSQSLTVLELVNSPSCPVQIDPELSVAKNCTGVTLNAPDLSANVCVDIDITNTGDTMLFIDSVTDSKLNNGAPLSLVGLDTELAPTESLEILDCYTTTSFDDPLTGEVSPSEVLFVDTVTVETHDNFGTEPSGMATAECPLCPCVDCD